MDLTSRYRARLPPREHRDTVKMLLRSIALNEPETRAPRRTEPGRGGSSLASGEFIMSMGNGEDALYRTSAARKPIRPLAEVNSSASSELEADSQVEEKAAVRGGGRWEQQQDEPWQAGEDARENPIPSRTIAVQCDLKASSATKQRQDSSMQVSSISSTRYGFYNLTAEALAQRRKLQRSISNRNIAEEQGSSDGLEARQQKSGASASESSSSYSHSRGSKHEEREEEEEGHQLSRASASIESSTARARINSLARRPTTALSHVSSSRLRDGAESDERSHSSVIRSDTKPVRRQSRAMSQMNLSRPRTPVAARESSPSCSDCDRCPATKPQPAYSSSYRSAEAPERIARPTLVSSTRNEHVRDYKTLERLPVRRNLRDPDEDFAESNASARPTRRPVDLGVCDSRRQRMPAEQLNRYGASEECASLGVKVKQSYNTDTKTPAYELYRSNLREHDRINSMSLNRKPKLLKAGEPKYNPEDLTNGYCTTKRVTRRPSKTNLQHESLFDRSQRSPSHEFLRRDARTEAAIKKGSAMLWNGSTEPLADRYDSGLYDSASSNQSFKQVRETLAGYVDEFDYEVRKNARASTDDSDCPLTKTWANPSSGTQSRPAPPYKLGRDLENRYKSNTRSYSMRDINAASSERVPDKSYMQECCIDYYKKQAPMRNSNSNHLQRAYESSPESSLLNAEPQSEYLRSQAMNYDSRHRLNEIGLPEVDAAQTNLGHQKSTSSSYLNMNTRLHGRLTPGSQPRAQIAGRALSQQQLVRPSMPLAGSRRRLGYSNSGSDAGGSSLSLANRVSNRQENAYTRTPVVMYIPQMSGSSLGRSGGSSQDEMSIGRGINLRRTLRSRQKSSSQDRSRRSLSRNGSESESSSMLRTLIRPKGSRLPSKRGGRQQQQQQLMQSQASIQNESEDNIGQLVSEMDSGKFRRRYSVPRNAKINWFSKLKQRVSSSVK